MRNRNEIGAIETVFMRFARCYKCFRLRVQHGWHQDPCEYCSNQSGEKSRCDAAHPSFVHAVNVARSYRFEERGRGLWATVLASTVNGKQTSGRRRCITTE